MNRIAEPARAWAQERAKENDVTDYPPEAVAIALARGYDPEAHAAAIAEDAECGCGGSDDISLTHPTNWLTEDEMTRLWEDAYPGIVASALA